MNLKYYKVGNRVIATMGKIDGTEITEEEFISEMQRVCANMEANAEAAYWASVPYDEAVNAKIRDRYTVSQEFAVLRQKEEKPDEYAAYYAYCEACKTLVKERKGL